MTKCVEIGFVVLGDTYFFSSESFLGKHERMYCLRDFLVVDGNIVFVTERYRQIIENAFFMSRLLETGDLKLVFCDDAWQPVPINLMGRYLECLRAISKNEKN